MGMGVRYRLSKKRYVIFGFLIRGKKRKKPQNNVLRIAGAAWWQFLRDVDGGGKDKNDHAFIMNYALQNL
jgi:hypothetical protein